MKISKKVTSKESFAILREIENRKCPDGVKYSEWREERDRQQTEAIRNLIPEGMDTHPVILFFLLVFIVSCVLNTSYFIIKILRGVIKNE